MDRGHLEELAAIEDAYWWNVGKAKLVQDVLSRFAPPPGRLVEGGVGACGNLARFRDLGYEVSGLDVSSAAVRHGLARGLDVKVHDLEQPWPVAGGGARAVVLLDVIEHLADPVIALARAREALAPGGAVVVTVPAYDWLRGPWDEMLGHRRRYSRAMLEAQAREAGLVPRWLSHWNLVSLPAAMLWRLAQRWADSAGAVEFPRIPGVLNWALERALSVERLCLAVAPAPAGVSIVGVFGR